jgi:hypothetical protein
MQLDFLHHTSLSDKSRFHLTQTKRRKKSTKHAHSFDDERNLIQKRCKYTHTWIALSSYMERWKHVIEECTGRNSAATRKLQKKCRGRTTGGKKKLCMCDRAFVFFRWSCNGCFEYAAAAIDLDTDPGWPQSAFPRTLPLCPGPSLGP